MSTTRVNAEWLLKRGFLPVDGFINVYRLRYEDALDDPAEIEFALSDITAAINVPGELWVSIPFENQDKAHNLLVALGAIKQ
jgi:hypothetical protein